ncbi:uncharacterized protein PG986_005757 [Apiospora aurea]|uniref:Uncharacterized protein n=1 Tax=Apiospora aurea TaxID=335848 RepID=A0ABR1QII5_9PEZI
MEPLPGHMKVSGTTIPLRAPEPEPTPPPEVNHCISVVQNKPGNLQPNLDNNDGWASIPEGKRLVNGKCQQLPGHEATFCPTTRFWYYGEPMAHDGVICHPQSGCGISKQIHHEFNKQVANGATVMHGSSQSHTIGFNMGFQMGIKNDNQDYGVNMGFTYQHARELSEQYSKSVTTTTGYSDSFTTITSIERPEDTKDLCGKYMVLPIYQGFCGVMAYKNETWDQWFTCGNHIVNGTFPHSKESVHSYQTVFSPLDCDKQRHWGPERQPPMYNQAIVWEDWAQWLMHKPRDADGTVTLERSNPHTGTWFGYEVRKIPVARSD